MPKKTTIKTKSNKLQNQALTCGVVGFIAGCVLVGAVASYGINNDNSGVMRAMGVHRKVEQTAPDTSDVTPDMTKQMSDMTAMLRNKTGDDFDKAFLEEMIPHHQGAVDMANLAKQYAMHDEIKQLADSIISGQSKEIDTMKGWQKDWGYSSDTGTDSGPMTTQ